MAVILHREYWLAPEPLVSRTRALLQEAQESIHACCDESSLPLVVSDLLDRAAYGLRVEVLVPARLATHDEGRALLASLSCAHLPIWLAPAHAGTLLLIDMVLGPGSPTSSVATLVAVSTLLPTAAGAELLALSLDNGTEICALSYRQYQETLAQATLFLPRS